MVRERERERDGEREDVEKKEERIQFKNSELK